MPTDPPELTEEELTALERACRGDPDPDGSCLSCNAPMMVENDCDPTPLCHECAQEVVQDVPRLLAMARRCLSAERGLATVKAERDGLLAWKSALEKKLDAGLLKVIVEHPGFIPYGPDEEEPEPIL